MCFLYKKKNIHLKEFYVKSKFHYFTCKNFLKNQVFIDCCLKISVFFLIPGFSSINCQVPGCSRIPNFFFQTCKQLRCLRAKKIKLCKIRLASNKTKCNPLCP